MLVELKINYTGTFRRKPRILSALIPDFRDILARYHKLARPVRNNNDSVKVSMKVFLQQIVNVVSVNFP